MTEYLAMLYDARSDFFDCFPLHYKNSINVSQWTQEYYYRTWLGKYNREIARVEEELWNERPQVCLPCDYFLNKSYGDSSELPSR